ncbi:MAG: Rrf2 family transcriptional regulator [Victivallaceae bacterium]|nr:Rrf2 family transcriptional regulator [Victivallaceae bacterium]
MKISTKTRYGLRIILQLTETLSGEKAVKGKDIVREQGISEPYMEQIMIKLRQAKWVVTERGCQGGYKLNVAPGNITVLDLIELFEGPVELVSCSRRDRRCKRFNGCRTAVLWQLLSESFRKEAKKVNLTQIIELEPGERNILHESL